MQYLITRKMNKVMKIMLQILMLMMLHISSGNSEIKPRPSAPALYVFGDSLFDSGNNNGLITLSKANYPPYGINFDKGPTGRFTNGRTVADFIAEFLGLPYSTPYLSLKGTVLGAEQLKGLNFASAACGILPDTGRQLGKCLNLAEQIGFFERIVKDELPKHYGNSTELSNYLSKSVLMISIGNNDYINNYLDGLFHDTQKRYSPESFASLLINHLSQQLQRLYELGARKVIMFELGPLGCMPCSVRLLNHTGKCVEEVNHLALLFNKELAPMLHTLTTTLQGSSFILGHVHDLGYDAIIHPSKYGLIDSSNPCCKAWFNGTSACVPQLSAKTCQHPEEYYFFDGYHLTETIYRTIATTCFNASSICIPKNIQELVSQV